jgi:hypothetical protein
MQQLPSQQVIMNLIDTINNLERKIDQLIELNKDYQKIVDVISIEAEKNLKITFIEK